MKNLLFLLVGAVATVAIVYALDTDAIGGKAGKTRMLTEREVVPGAEPDDELIGKLRARIAELEALLAEQSPPEASAYPDDTPEKVGVLLQEAYAENNVDWLLQVIERLLLMGERGYPMLRTIIMDMVFKAKFRPTSSDFRFDQLYTAGQIFMKHEKPFIGFLNFLLIDPQTNKLLKQGAVPVAAFYVGAKAPGSEELQQTLLQMFLAQGGGGLPAGMLPGNFGKRINLFAMMMSGDPQMISPLRDELGKEKDKKMQGEILGALAYLGDPKVLPDIKDRLDPNSNDDFTNEIRALGRLGTDEAHSAAIDFVRAIPDSKRFYRHASAYLRSGGGAQGVLLIKDRVTAKPDDPEVGRAVGTLRRFPTKESHETLQLISTTATDTGVAKRAAEAADDVGRRLRGELPEIAK